MFFIKNKFGIRIIKLLLTFRVFNNNFAVIVWNNSYLIRRTKPIEDLIKYKITEKNIFTLKYKYHGSSKVLKEYVAEIYNHNYENKKIVLNIWRNEQKIDFVKQIEIILTEQTNNILKELLDKSVFKEKYGNNYLYFISLHLDANITKIKEEERQNSYMGIILF